MVLGISAAASAVEVSLPAADKTWDAYTWTPDGDNYKATVEGYSLVLDKNTSTSNLVKPDQYSIRIYANAQLHVTAPEGVTFTKVEVTINATGNKATEATASNGWTVSAFDGGKFTITADTPQSSLTFDGAGKQLRVASMVITASGEGEGGGDDPTPDDPTPDDPTPDDPVEGDVTILFSDFAKNDDTANQEASKDGFTVVAAKGTGTTSPAVLPATNPTSLRIYADGTLTVSGEKITKIVFKLAETQAARYTTFTPSTGAYTAAQAEGDTELTWTGDAASVTFTVGSKATLGTEGDTKAGQIHIASITITGEGGEGGDTPVTPPTPAGNEYTVITTMVAGDYVIAAGEHAMDQIPESKTYGYPGVVAATFADGVLTTTAPVFTFEAATGGYYIKCADGRYLYQTGNYNSFNVSATPSDEGIFTVSIAADGTATITNTNVNKTLAFDPNYNSYGSYSEVGDRELPKLYVGKGDGIAEIATEEAPVEYFNLQGVRISEPAAGQIVIRRQGNKVSKIYVK